MLGLVKGNARCILNKAPKVRSVGTLEIAWILQPLRYCSYGAPTGSLLLDLPLPLHQRFQELRVPTGAFILYVYSENLKRF